MEHTINGNTGGVREILLQQMLELYAIECTADTFAPVELIEKMAHYTGKINREIMVYLSRAGEVKDVRIGDDKSVGLSEIRLVRNIDRLAGVRCIHTHPKGSGMLSDVDRGSLSSLKLDSMAAIGVDENGQARNFYAGFLGEMDGERRNILEYGPFYISRIPQKKLMEEISLADARFVHSAYTVTEGEPERAILIGIDKNEGYDSMEELASLAETAGVKVVGRVSQKKTTVDLATYIGSGKAEEISLDCSALEADLCIFDDELSAIQMRNLEILLGVPIIDRTTLILDIFAQRAQSREGKLQVELAQLKYRLPRLLGMGRMLSRQGGGVGTRGPGEKKLEIDRRRIRRRIFELEQELQGIEKQRELRRSKREGNKVPLVALVGYTNAGKSTLLNRLTQSDVLAEDKLFATLDPVIRKAELESGTPFLLADTVGFINKLPHDLVEAFKSTLEEVEKADLLLHVIDSSSDYADKQMEVVENVVASLGAADTPCIRVYNKADCPGLPLPKDGVYISAKTGLGMDLLEKTLEEELSKKQVRISVLVPYANYDVLELIRKIGTILGETHEAEGTRVEALVLEGDTWKIKSRLKT